MYLPMQSEPVQRTIAGQPSANMHRGGDLGGNREFGGIEPSGIFDDILGVVRTVGQVGSTVAPILGSLGI